MKRNIIKAIFTILTILLSSRVVYSQTNFWEPTSKLPDNVYQITVADNGDIWVATNNLYPVRTAAIYVSTDNGDNWIRKVYRTSDYSTLVGAMGINPVNGYIFIGVRDMGLLRSTDNGETWVNVTENVSPIIPSAGIIYMLITPSGEIHLYNLGRYSNDNGDTWTWKDYSVDCYSFTVGNDGTLYAGTDWGQIYSSTDSGETWVPISNRFDRLNVRVTSLIIYDDNGLIFGSTNWEGVLRSTDKGVTWSIINNGLDFTWLTDIIYNPKTRHLFVADERLGIYMSTNLGESWKLQNSGLPDSIGCYKLTSNPKTGQMFVITNANGGNRDIYRSTAQAISVEEPEEIPITYSLSQNYPNPFNPTTTIQYSIPKDEFVKLAVYDLTGRVVKELVSAHKTAGKYSVEFNASGLASGIYFYKLNTSGTPLINKMLLMK